MEILKRDEIILMYSLTKAAERKSLRIPLLHFYPHKIIIISYL